jgi:pyridoxamine 5'-phosphate oxidase
VEFFQGDTARRHVRLAYRRKNDSEGWSRQLLWP